MADARAHSGGTITYRYLIHPGQMTQTPYYHGIKTRVHSFTFERADQLRRLFAPHQDE